MPISLDPKSAWPPKEWVAVYDKYAEWAAWYGGDAQALCDFYLAKLQMFWGRRIPAGERRVQVHVPLAGDIASTSANLLFGEHPKVKIPEAEKEGPPREALDAQERLEKLIGETGFFARCLEAAEMASGLGGVFLKVDWDKRLAGHPFLSLVQADNALPEFNFGLLRAVTFWREVADDEKNVWRHLEQHELDADGNGVILNYLYKGTRDQIGSPVGLAERPETQGLPEATETGVTGLVCRYLSNMRPNRLWRTSYLGQSDYSGAEGLLDALDETMSNWLRDVRLAKGRILAPERYFQSDGAGNIGFDVDREAYVVLNVPPTPEGLKSEITVSQFAIRSAEHEQTALQLITNIVTGAGYSPQTFGLQIQGQAESGTALNIRRDKSYKTTAKKAEYWREPLADLLEIMLQVDRLHLGGKATPFRPNVEMQDGCTPDISQVAQTVELLRRAEAASDDVLVRMLHPDWTDAQVKAEVQTIEGGRRMALPDLAALGLDEGGNTGNSAG